MSGKYEVCTEIERRYTITPFQGAVSYGDISRISENTRFHLRSAHQVIAALIVDKPEWLKRVDDLIAQLEFGLPAPAMSLVKLPIRLTRGQYLTLHRSGLNNLADVAPLDKAKLAEYIGKQAAARLAEHLNAKKFINA